MRHATQLRTSQKSVAKAPAKTVSLSVVGGTASKTIAAHAERKTRRAAPSVPQQDCCVLCDVVIERFDRDVFHATGRCGPCDEAMEQDL